MIRWTTVVVLLGLLVAAVLVDRIDNDPTEAPVVDVVLRPTPAMAEVPPLASSWFCPVGSAGEGTYADARVTVTNLSSEPAVADLAIRTADGPGPGLRIDVAPQSSETVPLVNLGTFDAAGVAVEFVGGEGVVSHEVTTASGPTEGPCASEASSTWYFAGGSTTRDTQHVLVLLNPFPNDVVFTATFQTPTRTRQPSELEARTVPAQSVVVLDIGSFVAREPIVATTIETVAGGQLVAERLTVVDGVLGPFGAALESGVATPATSWVAPAGRIHVGGDNTLTVFNPTAEVAEVDVRLDPIAVEDRATFGLVPIELTVQPGRLATIDLRGLASQLVLPEPYDVGLTVTSANGVPIVMHRSQSQPGVDSDAIGAGTDASAEEETGDGEATDAEATDEEAVDTTSEKRRQNDGEVPADELPPAPEGPVYVQPTPRIGVAASHGSSLSSTRWVSAATTLLGDNGTAVIVHGEVGALVEVRLLVAGSLGSPVRASVDATGRAEIAIDPIAARAGVIVTSDQPIVAELRLVDAERYDTIAMVPTLGSDLAVVDPDLVDIETETETDAGATEEDDE